MSSKRRHQLVLVALELVACSVDARGGDGAGVQDTGTSPSGTETGAEGSTTAGSSAASSDGAEGPKLDVGADTDDPGADACVVQDIDAPGACATQAPADSFAPQLEWSFGEDLSSMVTPLVANLTDDDGNGSIDLCDTPDVVLLTTDAGDSCTLWVLDGATGAVHWQLDGNAVSCFVTPALGDIDADGVPELVTGWVDKSATPHRTRLRAFEHDGTAAWFSTGDTDPMLRWDPRSGASVALHDLDADGDVEIVFDHDVFDHEGQLLWRGPTPELTASTVGCFAVDLDDDGWLEVVVGSEAYRHDGTPYWSLQPTVPPTAVPQVAQLDDDASAELVINTYSRHWLVEHDGTITAGPLLPPGGMQSFHDSPGPGAVHDFDGDGRADWALFSDGYFAVYRAASDVLWSVPLMTEASATATAFDFLGDGTAEAIYTDDTSVRALDGATGTTLFELPRIGVTLFQYPVVVDVDDDGSSEILVVSMSGQPALSVFGDAEDRWVQARRIWNQHAYYVTNVREDGTIPQHVADPWTTLGTFRTQAQIEGGALCRPPG